MLAKLKRIPQKNAVSSSARLVVHIFLVVVLMSTVLLGLFGGVGEGHAQAQGATIAEKKADARAVDTSIATNCENAALNPDGSTSDFLEPCKARFKAFYLGDGSTAPDCPPDDGSANYQYCQESAPRNGLQARNKDFPNITDVCNAFISNNSGGSWPNFANLSGSEKAAAIKQCQIGLAQGLTYAPGDYPNSASCDPGNVGNKDIMLKACYAGRSLADAHIFTFSEAKAIAKAGNLPMTDNSSNGSGGGTGPGVNGGGAAGAGGVSCDLGISLSVGGVLNAINPLNWLLCGIVKGMNMIVTSLDDQINSMLVLGTGGNTSSDNPNNIFTDSSGTCGAKDNACDNYYTAWQSFRNIALGLLVIVGLIVVISQALGMEILDAYTIRKMLPRVLIATIAIVLSWQLMRFCVTVSNDLGYGVGNLLDAPFHGLGQNIKVGGANGLLATFALALGGAFFDLFGMLAFVGTAALAVIVTFLVLTLRQIAVILLVIFSPVAIIAYVLPNTQRVYKFWWESFSKLLLMFPMIVAFLTAGHIFSAIASDQGNGFVHQTIAFIAYFGPYFAIPMTFRFAGGLMNGLGNAVNSRFEGARGMLSNVRSNRAKYNAGRLKAGTRFEGRIPGTRRIQGGLNKATRGIGTGFKGRFGLGAAGGEAGAQAGMTAAKELLRTPGMQAIKGKNDFNRILAEGMGDEVQGRKGLFDHLMQGGDDGKFGEDKTYEQKVALANQSVDAAARAAKVAGGFTAAHGVAALYNMAQDGTAIRDTDDLARLSAKAGQGNGNATYTVAAETAKMSRDAGRPDLAAASEPIGALAFAHSDRMFKKGLLNPDSSVSDKKLDSLRAEAWASGRGGENAYNKYASAKGRAVRNDTRTAVDVLKAHRKAVQQGVDSPYSEEIVQLAAANLVDDRKAIENNYGKINNRADAGKELAKDEGALDFYLGTKVKVTDTHEVGHNPDGTSKFESVERETTNDELVKKIVGDREANLTPAQRAEWNARRAAGEEADQENENNR
jgi:hypothetical protein